MVNSKDKGKRGEREFCKALTEALGLEARRGVQYQGGDESPDVVCKPLKGVHFEVKRTEKLELSKAQAQACRDAGVNVPVVGHRRNRGQWWVMVPLAKLKDLVLNVKDAIDQLEGGQGE